MHQVWQRELASPLALKKKKNMLRMYFAKHFQDIQVFWGIAIFNGMQSYEHRSGKAMCRKLNTWCLFNLLLLSLPRGHHSVLLLWALNLALDAGKPTRQFRKTQKLYCSNISITLRFTACAPRTATSPQAQGFHCRLGTWKTEKEFPLLPNPQNVAPGKSLVDLNRDLNRSGRSE